MADQLEAQSTDQAMHLPGYGLPPSKLSREEAYQVLKRWFLADADHSAKWRTMARKYFSFYAGRQWESEDIAKLNDEKRPVITFNQCLVVIKAVCGLEVNGRKKIAFLPRGGTADAEGLIKVATNELITGASDWMSDEARAEHHQSEAFQDMTICGMGWVEPKLDYELEPDGKYQENKVNPIEMYWDKDARLMNLSDARRLYRARRVSLEDALAQFPGKTPEQLDATWVDMDGITSELDIVGQRTRMEEGTYYNDPHCHVTIVHAQWYELEPMYRVVDPTSGKAELVNEVEFARVAKIAEQSSIKLIFTKQGRRVYKQAFLGSELLTEIGPTAPGDAFTFRCITGERDQEEGTWFGLIKLMYDPQTWFNKWLSQILHMLNTTAKGGILAERKAFGTHMAEAQATYAKPEAITLVENDAIKDGRIMQKPGAANFTGHAQLLQLAQGMIRTSVGVNLELLGQQDAAQAGIVENARKQASMTILATMFDAQKLQRMEIGNIRLSYIQKYLSNDQLIRISNSKGMYLVQLTKDKTRGRYEVIVDDAPTSPNEQQETWDTIKAMFPIFGAIMTPEVLGSLLDYSPLPAQLRQSLKTLVMKPNPQAEQAAMVALRAALAKIAKTQAEAQLTGAKVNTEQTAALENLADLNEANAEAALDQAKAELLKQLLPNPALLGPRLPGLPVAIPHLPLAQPGVGG